MKRTRSAVLMLLTVTGIALGSWRICLHAAGGISPAPTPAKPTDPAVHPPVVERHSHQSGGTVETQGRVVLWPQLDSAAGCVLKTDSKLRWVAGEAEGRLSIWQVAPDLQLTALSGVHPPQGVFREYEWVGNALFYWRITGVNNVSELENVGEYEYAPKHSEAGLWEPLSGRTTVMFREPAPVALANTQGDRLALFDLGGQFQSMPQGRARVSILEMPGGRVLQTFEIDIGTSRISSRRVPCPLWWSADGRSFFILRDVPSAPRVGLPASAGQPAPVLTIVSEGGVRKDLSPPRLEIGDRRVPTLAVGYRTNVSVYPALSRIADGNQVGAFLGEGLAYPQLRLGFFSANGLEREVRVTPQGWPPAWRDRNGAIGWPPRILCLAPDGERILVQERERSDHAEGSPLMLSLWRIRDGVVVPIGIAPRVERISTWVDGQYLPFSGPATTVDEGKRRSIIRCGVIWVRPGGG